MGRRPDRLGRIAPLAHSFSWVFDAFGAKSPLHKVDLRAVRALMARVRTAVRTEIPHGRVELDFESIDAALRRGPTTNHLLAISTSGAPWQTNMYYVYSATMLAKELGLSHWVRLNDLIARVLREKQIDIKASDNAYHLCQRTGERGTSRRYSEAARSLLALVRDNQPYEVDPNYLEGPIMSL